MENYCKRTSLNGATQREETMTRTLATIAAVVFTATTLASCGNTIRGMGQDTANTVDATQNAGKRVDRAARY